MAKHCWDFPLSWSWCAPNIVLPHVGHDFYVFFKVSQMEQTLRKIGDSKEKRGKKGRKRGWKRKESSEDIFLNQLAKIRKVRGKSKWTKRWYWDFLPRNPPTWEFWKRKEWEKSKMCVIPWKERKVEEEETWTQLVSKVGHRWLGKAGQLSATQSRAGQDVDHTPCRTTKQPWGIHLNNKIHS